jgi:hypothetical protein
MYAVTQGPPRCLTRKGHHTADPSLPTCRFSTSNPTSKCVCYKLRWASATAASNDLELILTMPAMTCQHPTSGVGRLLRRNNLHNVHWRLPQHEPTTWRHRAKSCKVLCKNNRPVNQRLPNCIWTSLPHRQPSTSSLVN